MRTISRRWWPEAAGVSRGWTAIALNLSPAMLAVALFVIWAPAAHWDHPELLGALAAIAAVAFLAEVRLKMAFAVYFDATIVLALLALVIAGPLPALLVWIVPDAITRLVIRRTPLIAPDLIANVTSYALALLAGEAVLELASAPSSLAQAPALYTAGLVIGTINFTFARLNFAPFYQHSRVTALVRAEFVDLLAGFLAMLILGVETYLLIPPLGVFALALLTAVVVLPQLALALLVRARSVTALSPDEATALYAAAIADVLALPKRERTIIACVAELLSDDTDGAEPHARWRFEDVPEVVQAALHIDERWDGTGRPAGLSGGHAPLASRVVSVARAWADLTAAGTLQLPHHEAILGIGVGAGAQFDPAIVAAAARVVADEQTFVRDPDFQPRLHSLPLPRPLRRDRMPAALGRLAQPA